MSIDEQRKMPFVDVFQPEPGSNVKRIISLSDCVIAVAFTLLVENTRLPSAGLSESQLLSYVEHSLLPDVFVYLFSYIVVASSWISHYRIFNAMKRSNGIFIMLNVSYLASIVFLPVPVILFYVYGNQSTVWLVYISTQLVTSTLLLFMWLEARQDHLLDPTVPSRTLKFTTVRLLVLPLGALISIVVVFYNVLFAEGVFMLSYVLSWLLQSIYYRHNPTVGIIEGASRLWSITDNMVAVAITFLIAKITGVVIANSHQSLPTTLNTLFGQLQVYSFSLLIVGFYWLSHHRIFMLIRRHDMVVIWLNFAFLFFIELQPVLNVLRASYPKSQIAEACYASGQALTGLMLLSIWIYAARKHRLIDTTMSTSHIISLALRILLPPMIFILSVAVIYFRNDIAIYIWVLVIILEVADLIYRRARHERYQ